MYLLLHVRRMLRENVSSSLIEDQKKKKEKDSI